MLKTKFILLIYFIGTIVLIYSCESFNPEQISILTDPEAMYKALKSDQVWPKRIYLGQTTDLSDSIFAYYYNKGGTKKAMIISGVHGSEYFGVDVAYDLKERLDGMNVSKHDYQILLIPELFKANVKKARDPKYLFTYNIGRETSGVYSNGTNREMPTPGSLHCMDCLAHNGKIIQTENQYLLTIIQAFNPDRIATLHCKNETYANQIGIYADPRTDQRGINLGYDEDSTLAMKMALKVRALGGRIYGNFRTSNSDRAKMRYETIYPYDPPVSKKGEFQKRNYQDTNDRNEYGKVTFGTWASTEVSQNNKLLKKAAMTFTFEMPQYYSFYKFGFQNSFNRPQYLLNRNTYSLALKEEFLNMK